MTETAKIGDYVGSRVRIEPTGFDRVETRFTRGKIERMWARVIVDDLVHDWPLDLGIVTVFNHALIDQVKRLYVGRPITGTLIRKPDPSGRRPMRLELANIEEN